MFSLSKCSCYWYYPDYYESGTFDIHILHICSRLFELFTKEVRVKKQQGMSSNLKLIDCNIYAIVYTTYDFSGWVVVFLDQIVRYFNFRSLFDLLDVFAILICIL